MTRPPTLTFKGKYTKFSELVDGDYYWVWFVAHLWEGKGHPDRYQKMRFEKNFLQYGLKPTGPIFTFYSDPQRFLSAYFAHRISHIGKDGNGEAVKRPEMDTEELILDKEPFYEHLEGPNYEDGKSYLVWVDHATPHGGIPGILGFQKMVYNRYPLPDGTVLNTKAKDFMEDVHEHGTFSNELLGTFEIGLL